MEKQNTSIEVPHEILMECLALLLQSRLAVSVTRADSYSGLVTLNVTHDKNSVIHSKTLKAVDNAVFAFASLLPDLYSRFPESIPGL